MRRWIIVNVVLSIGLWGGVVDAQEGAPGLNQPIGEKPASPVPDNPENMPPASPQTAIVHRGTSVPSEVPAAPEAEQAVSPAPAAATTVTHAPAVAASAAEATSAPVPSVLPADPVAPESASAVPAASAEPNTLSPSVNEPVSSPADVHSFSKLTISPLAGYSFFPSSSYKFDGLKLKVDNRNSFSAKVQLDVGGDGLAFALAPLFSMEQIGGNLSSFKSDLGEGVAGKFFAVGGQMGLVLRGKLGRFYPHLGLGFHGTYLMGDDIEHGAELYGRIPVGFSIYMARRLALVVEFAFMYGATGIKGPNPDTSVLAAELQQDYNVDISDIDWSNTTPEQIQNDYNLTEEEVNSIMEEQIARTFQFGKGYALEVMVGLRFP